MMTKTTTHRSEARIPFWIYWATVSALYAAVFVTIEFSDFPISGPKGLAMLITQWGIASLAAAGLIGLLTINRYVAAAGLPLLAGASAAAAYFKLTMAASLTPAIVELWAVTGMATSMDLVSLQLVAWVTAAMAAAAGLAAVRWKMVDNRFRLTVPLVCAVALVSLSKVPRCENAIYARIPYSFYSSVKGYLEMRKVAAEERTTFDGMAAYCTADTIDVVVVIGESLRADHLPMNGYGRQTMPRLSAEANLTNLPHVYTHPFHTYTSVPFMMTRASAASEADEERAYNEQSFITLFKNAGFSTYWLSNQEDSETYTYFMHEADSLIRNNPSINLYNFTPHLDTELLPHFDRILASAGSPRRLFVIHSIGSHWWYGCHFDAATDAVFQPIAQSKVLSDNSLEQMTNSYDNTILATDRFISRLIDRLRDRNCILFYQSDHGESLGEEGRLLHGEDAPELHYPAAFIWFSDSYASRNAEKIGNMQDRRSENLTTEYLFHSVIDGACIATEAADHSQSIFR